MSNDSSTATTPATKALLGCGGCSCAFFGVGGVVATALLIWGLTDRAVKELVVPSIGGLIAAVLFGAISLAVLVAGVVKHKKEKAAAAAAAAAEEAPGDEGRS